MISLQEARGCNYIWEQVLHVQESSSPRAGGGAGSGGDGGMYGPRRMGDAGTMDDFDVGMAGPAGRYDG